MSESVEQAARCGHTATGQLGPLVCDKSAGHKGFHEQRDKLRDGIVRTNWGSDGLSLHATKDVGCLSR